MNMHWIDWGIALTLLVIMGLVVFTTKRYMCGVADFLAAGRCGGRYLLCISEGIAGLGAVTLLAFWQQYTKTGFTGIWWSLPNWPLLFILALSGWVLYRYRQTRALTLAQLLEMRYSRRFRIFTGMVAFISGIINYGVFPGLNARLFIHFCGLPETFSLAGLSIPTFPLVMLVLLSLALYFAFMGGQIAIMLTNFLQGIFCMAVLLITCLVLLNYVGWNHINDVVMTAPEDQSLVNPFKISGIEGFSMRFFLIQYFIWFYSWKAWQGTQGYNAAAKTPHEARMSQILGTWRYFAQEMIIPIFAICALAVLLHPDFAQQAAGVKEVLAGFPNDKVQSEMTVPLVLGRVLPVGLMGALMAVMMAAAISTDESYLHSWGSIFIQDVLMPLRGKPLNPDQHLRYLRYSICGVALFAFLFSMVFSLADYIRMFFAITGAIYLGGAGCCIIGGLYTRRGTTAGAWGAMITGIVVASTGIITNQIAAAAPQAGGVMAWLQLTLYQNEALRIGIEYLGAIDGQVMAFITALCAVFVYIILSILSGGKKFNLDRMLHRGQYAIADDLAKGDASTTARWKWLGINEAFTRWDWMSVILGVVTVLWFLIGGLRDLKIMFELLRTRIRDHTDDGTVREGDQPAGTK